MSDSRRPNILFITSDQHRSDYLGCAGHPSIMTPNLDRLASSGMRFTNAYTDCPICIPARTTIITGVQSHHYGMPSYGEHFRIDRPREQFLGSLLTRAGYQTQLIGKTHWHTPGSFRAGFENIVGYDQLHDERARIRPTGAHGLGANEVYPGLSMWPPELYSTDWTVDRGVEFLQRRDRTQPFFLWLSFIDPHPPFQIHEPYYSMYDDAEIPEAIIPSWVNDHCPRMLRRHQTWYNNPPMKPATLRKSRGIYQGMITNMDYQLSRIFGQLLLSDDWKDTWIVYTTDHGDHLGDFGDFAKSSFLEASANLPFIVRPPLRNGSLPNFQPGQTSRGLIELADLLPTFCEIAGADVPEDVDGRSIVPLVEESNRTIRESLHAQIDHGHMYHDGRYKYLYFTDDGAELVFDKENDPHDEHDLSSDTKLVERLRREFIEHLRSENHSDLIDGEPKNEREPLEPEAVLRSQLPMGWQATLRN